MPSERTPLVRESVPNYVFHTTRDRQFRRRVRQFQCAICAVIITALAVALVITISLAVDEEDSKTTDIPSNVTEPTSTPVPNTTTASAANPMDDLPPAMPPLPLGLSLSNEPVPPPLLARSWPIKDKPFPEWNETIDQSQLLSAISVGREKLYKKDVFEEKVPSLPIESPSYRHGLATSTSAEARLKSRAGYIMEAATRELLRGTKGRGEVGRSALFEIDWLPEEVCNKRDTPKCEPSRYRSYDGSCNNLRHPLTWGVAMMPFRRMLPPDYADGISAPRKASDGSSLPSARDVSTTVHRPSYRDDPKFTVMLAVWGQFLDHDITATAISKGKDGQFISCCNRFFQAGLVPHPECYTVPITAPDPFYLKMNVTCMEFVRASPAPMCSFGPREQLNQASNFIDGSVVYGNSEDTSNRLRSFRGGQMKTLVTSDNIHLLPISSDPNDGCNQEEQLAKGRYCFETGDARANENTHLTTLHLLFIRLHNDIANQLSELNLHWDDERLFQESRKVIAAQMQHIHYNEFLPVVVGPRLTNILKMTPREKGYSDTYDEDLDPSIANGFAAAAYRFGHTLLPRLFHAVGKDNSSDEFIEMHKMLFNPFQLYDKGFIEKAVRGSIETPIKTPDGSFSQEFTQHLFERESNKTNRKPPQPGLDLVALNIQRGRDNGLPAYPEFRVHCGLSRPTSFEDLEHDMDNGSVARMREIYKTVDDIDFYTGAVSERPLEGSLVGPTVTCLLTDQFLRLQRGDRFWYETSEQPQAFSPEQLDSLRQTSLAKVLCYTSYVDEAQPRVMESKRPDNQRVKCTELPGLDLLPWKEDIGEKTGKWSQETMKLKKLENNGGNHSLRLVGGKVSVSGWSIWENGLPLAFPSKIFQIYPPADSESPNTDQLLLNGTVHVVDSQFIRINGLFSFPRNTDGVKAWVNGKYDLHFQSNGSMKMYGKYSVQVYTAEKGEKGNTEETLTRINMKFEESTKPQFEDQSGTQNISLILFGTYSIDRTEFLWPGECLLQQSKTEILESLSEEEKPKGQEIDAFVNGGSITVGGKNIWVGNRVPLAIPLGQIQSLAPVRGSHKLGKAVPWNGYLQSANPRTIKLWGEYSLPLHDTNLSTIWYNGDFALQLKLYEDTNLNLNGSYSSFFYLQETPSQVDVQSSWSLAADGVLPSNVPTQFTNGSRFLPVIIYGMFSADGSSFVCSGNVTLVIR